MGATFTPRPIQYLVEEDGQRVGVVLRWEDYQKLCATHPVDPDLLVSLSDAELQALADSVLVPRQQERLSDLLRRNRDEGLSADEERELDRLLERIDQMNVLKARRCTHCSNGGQQARHNGSNRFYPTAPPGPRKS